MLPSLPAESNRLSAGQTIVLKTGNFSLRLSTGEALTGEGITIWIAMAKLMFRGRPSPSHPDQICESALPEGMGIRCNVTVKQDGGHFSRGPREHCHPPEKEIPQRL